MPHDPRRSISVYAMAHLETLIAFFGEEHNANMPHSAFAGQTPDEMCLGTATNLPDELVVARGKAREGRLAMNRAVSLPSMLPRLRAGPRHQRIFRDCRDVALANAKLRDVLAPSTASQGCRYGRRRVDGRAVSELAEGVAPPTLDYAAREQRARVVLARCHEPSAMLYSALALKTVGPRSGGRLRCVS